MLKLALDLSQILSCLENKIWLKKKKVLGFVVEKKLQEEDRRKKNVGVEENNEEIILDILKFFKWMC